MLSRYSQFWAFTMANLTNDATQYAQSHAKRVYILAIVTSMGALMFGYDLAFIGTSIGLDPFKKYLTSCLIQTSGVRYQLTFFPQGFRAY